MPVIKQLAKCTNKQFTKGYKLPRQKINKNPACHTGIKSNKQKDNSTEKSRGIWALPQTS